MRPAVARVLLVLLVPVAAGCGQPVFVPEAGPGAPGYSQRPAPTPPGPAQVKVLGTDEVAPLPPGGSVDGVVRHEGEFEIKGWALLDASSPRGTLQLVLPPGVDGSVRDVAAEPRQDVVDATGSQDLLWSGFTITVQGSLPEDSGVCVLSRSKQGAFRLGGSDEVLCPA